MGLIDWSEVPRGVGFALGAFAVLGVAQVFRSIYRHAMKARPLKWHSEHCHCTRCILAEREGSR